MPSKAWDEKWRTKITETQGKNNPPSLSLFTTKQEPFVTATFNSLFKSTEHDAMEADSKRRCLNRIYDKRVYLRDIKA